MPSSGGSVSDVPTNKTVDGQDHQLAYITPEEAQNLVDQGGNPTMTNEGVMAYPPQDNYTSNYDSSQNQSGRNENTSGAGGGSSYSGGNNNREQAIASQHTRARTEAAQAGTIVDDEYDTPDTQHYNKTQKEIRKKSKDVVDTKMSKDEYEQFNKDLNDYYGTKDVKYEPYGRAGQGTVNLSFKEHWDNIGMQNPMLKFSPIARFIGAAGRNIGEYLKSDYGTGKYAGPGSDKGGLLGRIGIEGGGSYQVTPQDRDIMNQLSPEAPYIISGTKSPTNSPAANWYQSLGNTSTNQFQFSFANELSAAKAKQASILGNQSAVGWLAVNQSPFYNFLKENKLDKGIL